VKIGPKGEKRYEDPPPSPAYVGLCDHISVSEVHMPKVRNQSENFGRGPIDWGKSVSPGPNQAGDLESILFKNVKGSTRDATTRFQPSDTIYFIVSDILRVKDHILQDFLRSA